jgi:hypothetical protein
VAPGGDDGRFMPAPAVGPRLREGTGEVGMVGLEHDLPGLAPVADDHREARQFGTVLTRRSYRARGSPPANRTDARREIMGRAAEPSNLNLAA